MNAVRYHRFAQRALVVLSSLALITVLIGFTQPPQPDEGALAHIFQLTVVAFGFTLLGFLATADRMSKRRESRSLIVPAATISAAFVALFCLEHLR